MCRLSVLTDRDKKSCDVFCDRCSVFLRSKSQKTEEEIGTLLVFTNFPYYGFNSYTRILRFFFFFFFCSALAKASIQMVNQNSTNPRTDRRRTLRFQSFPKEIFF